MSQFHEIIYVILVLTKITWNQLLQNKIDYLQNNPFHEIFCYKSFCIVMQLGLEQKFHTFLNPHCCEVIQKVFREINCMMHEIFRENKLTKIPWNQFIPDICIHNVEITEIKFTLSFFWQNFRESNVFLTKLLKSW